MKKSDQVALQRSFVCSKVPDYFKRNVVMTKPYKTKVVLSIIIHGSLFNIKAVLYYCKVDEDS